MAFTFKLRRQLSNSSIESIPRDSIEYYTLVDVQNRLLKIDEENSDLFDSIDVENIIMSKTYLRRFAQRRNGNADKTVEMVKNTLIWRKEHKVPLVTRKLIPKEFYDLGVSFMHGTDFEGNVVLHLRAKYAVFDSKVVETLHRYFAFYLFKCIEDSLALPSDKGWTLCADLTGMSMAQCDLPEVLWILKVIVNYMPAGLKSIIYYNVPWFAKPFVKLILSFVPGEWRRIIHIVGYKELLKLLPKESIPRYIDHPKEPFSAPVPPDAKPLKELDITRFGVNKDDLLEYIYVTLAKIS